MKWKHSLFFEQYPTVQDSELSQAQGSAQASRLKLVLSSSTASNPNLTTPARAAAAAGLPRPRLRADPSADPVAVRSLRQARWSGF